jgi:hypothetical protein
MTVRSQGISTMNLTSSMQSVIGSSASHGVSIDSSKLFPSILT